MTIDQTLRRDLLKSTAPSHSGGNNGSGADPPTGMDLDQHLVSSSKQVLLKKIDFQPAERDVTFQLQNLRVKYVPLNPGKAARSSVEETTMKSNKQNVGSTSGKFQSDGIPPPKRVLCSPDVVSLPWKKYHRIGSGLINMGNTCFLNSVLQCLCYTPPLVNYLLSHHHKEECKEFGFCMMCALQTHIQRAFQHNQPAIRPMVILNKLKHIAKHFHQGRQEDAHEFLRYLIEAMQKSCISGLEKLDRLSKETSIVYQVFGGYYRSRVTCAACQGKSDTYDPFLDVGLDIKHAPSVHKAFERLIRPETLDGENMYQCKKCNRKVQAQKRFTIHRAPKILTLCLKRFDFNRFSMGKIHKDVAYNEYINLRPYMSDPKGHSVMYQLYAVLKHEGASCNSGHYYCYVKAPNQSWYCMNDAYVSQVGLNRVLNQNAYLLFYVQREAKPSINGSMRGQDSKSSIKQHPATSTKPANPYNGPIGTVVPRQPSFIGPVKPKVISDKPTTKMDITPAKHANLPAAVPLPDQRTKLTFTLKKPGTVQNTGSKLVKPVVGNSPTSVAPAKDIKSPFPQDTKGKVVASTTSITKLQLQGLVKPKAKPPADTAATSSKTSFTGLVPYSGEDSSSDSENYDALAEQLSKIPPESSNGSKEGKDKVIQNGSAKVKSDGVKKEMIAPKDGGMKPPSQVVSHSDTSAAAAKKRSLANGTDLTVLRKPDSPLKLTITTNGNAQRLKATGHWRVSDAESQVSPSPASDSSLHSNHSNVSTNSTSEWSVLEKKDAPSTPKKMKEEAAVYGWNVTPSRMMMMRSFSDPGEVNKPHSGKYDPAERKPVKEAEDLQGSNVWTSDWLHNKHISHQTESETPFGFNVKEVTPLKDSKVPRNLNSMFHKDVKVTVEKNSSTLKENNYSAVYAKGMNGHGKEMTATDVPGKKKKKHKKHQQDGDDSEMIESVKCEETAVKTESEKAISPDAGDKDSGYYSIKSKNNNSDVEEGEDGEDEDAEHRKPKKHKKKKKKKRTHDHEFDKSPVGVTGDDDERTNNAQYNDQEEYGPMLPDPSKRGEPKDEDVYGPRLPEKLQKHKSHERILPSPDHRHRSETEHRLKSPEHKNRHNKSGSESNRFRSPDRDGRAGHKFGHGHEYKSRHRSDDRHYVRSPDYDRHYKSPSYDHNRVRSPDYEHKHKKHRSGDSDSTKYRTHDRHRHSSDESERHYSKFSTNRTSDDEDHSYAKRIKDRKRKRKHRDRDDCSRDEYSDRDWDSRRDDHRRDKGDGFSRLGSPNKKRKSLNGDSWDESGRGKVYRDDRRKSDGKPRHEAPVQQWDHHIKDGYKRSSHDDNAASRLSQSWDGKRSSSNSNVVEELNQSSMRAYGPAISSWEGGRSAIDEDIERDTRSEWSRDMYDQEFDRGKVKKVKYRHESDSNKHSAGYHNPFQAEQTRRNKGHSYQDHYDRHRSYPKKSHSWHSGR